MSNTHDGTGAPLDPAAHYYVQDTRSLVGNCILWWAKESKGYVCDLGDAGVYTGADVTDMRETDVPWPVAYVDARVVRHVRGDNKDFGRVTWSKRGKDGGKR